MNEDESAIQQGMSEFYQRTLRGLPEVPARKPFEVRVEEQKTESVPFATIARAPLAEDDQQSTLAPPPPGITSVNPNVVSSAGGTTVTITGTNFVSGSTVKIAGISATSITFVNSTTITCVTPADGLGWMTVEVTSPSGQVASLANAINYIDFPDNFVVSGQLSVQGYQGCNPGPIYTYGITARIGTDNFTPPPGVIVHVSIVLVGFSDDGNCGWGGSTSSINGTYFPPISGDITNATGPTINLEVFFSIHAVTPGSYGHSVQFYAIAASRNGTIGSRFPTWGDPRYQSSSFRIDVAGDGPLPTGGGGGSVAHFAWYDVSAFTPGSFFAAHNNPFSWLSGASHTLQIKRILASGAVDTAYNGTATIFFTRIIPTTGFIEFNAGHPTTLTFASGLASFGCQVDYIDYSGVERQHLGYFYLGAVDGVVTGTTGTCAVLDKL